MKNSFNGLFSNSFAPTQILEDGKVKVNINPNVEQLLSRSAKNNITNLAVLYNMPLKFNNRSELFKFQKEMSDSYSKVFNDISEVAAKANVKYKKQQEILISKQDEYDGLKKQGEPILTPDEAYRIRNLKSWWSRTKEEKAKLKLYDKLNDLNVEIQKKSKIVNELAEPVVALGAQLNLMHSNRASILQFSNVVKKKFPTDEDTPINIESFKSFSMVSQEELKPFNEEMYLPNVSQKTTDKTDHGMVNEVYFTNESVVKRGQFETTIKGEEHSVFVGQEIRLGRALNISKDYTYINESGMRDSGQKILNDLFGYDVICGTRVGVDSKGGISSVMDKAPGHLAYSYLFVKDKRDYDPNVEACHKNIEEYNMIYNNGKEAQAYLSDTIVNVGGIEHIEGIERVKEIGSKKKLGMYVGTVSRIFSAPKIEGDLKRNDSRIIPLNDLNFQKEYQKLQIMDFIGGQIDRHAGNFMLAKLPNGKIKITGIDNDSSFGCPLYFKSEYMSKLERIFPVMDANLRKDIMKMKPEDVENALNGVVNRGTNDKDAAKMAAKRLEYLQEFVKNRRYIYDFETKDPNVINKLENYFSSPNQQQMDAFAKPIINADNNMKAIYCCKDFCKGLGDYIKIKNNNKVNLGNTQNLENTQTQSHTKL